MSIGGQTSKARADQLTPATKRRRESKIGTLTSAEPEAVEKAMKVQLGLPL